MKKFRKLTVAILALTLMCALAVFFAACGDDGKVTGITVEPVATTSNNVIQGSELNYSNYKLVVDMDGKKEEIALNAEGVSVTGFDKNKLGEQEITVTYKEQTTTFKVSVVAQMVAENFDANYFIGEKFNVKKGRVRIYREDGTNYTKSLSDEAVTIGEFDSSAEGAKTVTVRCDDGGKIYSCTLTANVYMPEDVKLSNPNKISYKSHETELNVAGGYLTLENKKAGLKKDVTLTADMCTGYDPSEATIANLDKSLEQPITVTYQGITKNFNVYVTYSGISLMRLRAKELSDLKWETSIPNFTNEQGDNAVEAVKRFFKEADQDLLTDEEIMAVVRVATVRGYRLWQSEMDKFKRTFYFGKDGHVYFEYESADSTKANARLDYEELAKEDTPVRVYGEMLNEITEQFSEKVLYKDKGKDLTVIDYLSAVNSTNYYNYILSGLDMAEILFDRLADVNGEWKTSEAQKKDIKAAIKYIYDKEYAGNNYGDESLCRMVGKWRGDSLDIPYTFIDYCYSENDVESLNLVKFLWLPGQFEELMEEISGCLEMVSMIISPSPLALRFDTSDFMLGYRNVRRLEALLSESKDPLDEWLYNSIQFDMQLDESTSYAFSLKEYVEFIKTSGYDIIHGAYLGDEQYLAVWEQFLDILENLEISEGEYITDLKFNAETGAAIENMFNSFIALSPAQQYGFLAATNPLYETSLVTIYPYVLDFVTIPGGMTAFTQLISTYYKSLLPEEAVNVFAYMLRGLEDYARIYEDAQQGQASYFYTYIINMTLAAATYTEDLSAEAKAEFDKYLGATFAKQLAVYNTYDVKAEYDKDEDGNDVLVSFTAEQKDGVYPLGEWDADFKQMVLYSADVLSYASAGYYEGAISSFERVNEISQKILNSGDQAAIDAYRYLEYDMNKALAPEGDSSQQKFVMTMDALMREIQTTYVAALTQGFGTNVWADYQKSEALKQFMYDCYDFYNLAFKEPEDYTAEDKQIIIDTVTAFRGDKLSDDDKALFMTMTVNGGNLYYITLAIYINGTLGIIEGDDVKSTPASTYASEVIYFEAAYTAYTMATEANKPNALKNLTSQYNKMEASKKELTVEDKNYFTEEGGYKFIEEMYEHYVNLYRELVK